MQFNRSLKKLKKTEIKPVLDLVVSHHQITLRSAGNDPAYTNLSDQKSYSYRADSSNDSERWATQFKELLKQKWLVLVNLITLMMILGFAMAVVFQAYQVRSQVSLLANLQAERDQLQDTWAHLILEQNTLAALDRVEDLATYQLGMKYPTPKEMVLVKQKKHLKL